jgi:hypothetical protein
MSGSFAAALVGAADLAISLFGAGEQPVTLGDFVFAGYEVPESIRWGGSQSLAVHKLVGGERIIDAMGPDDADIGWSGIFLSSDASDRADELDQMRLAGVPVSLLFSGRSYDVVVRSFRADQRKSNHVPYNIVCTVLRDFGPNPPAPTILSQVTDDLNQALGFDVPQALAGVQTALQTVTPVLVPLVSLVGGTAASVAVAKGLGAATALSTAAGDLAAGQIAGITEAASSVGNVVGAATAANATANMRTAGAATEEAAKAAAMQAYIGRAQKNVANA